MKPLIEKQFNKYLANRLDYSFKTNQPGIYLIEITIRCKNWYQNWKKLFDDDDLGIEINNIGFPKLKKQGFFNAPAAFNGNRLKNLSQTNFYLIKLDKIENIISFIPDQKPYLEEIKIYQNVMQVADPRNPAIHTLNNDGWVDPRTGRVAREYEIINGEEQVLDYKGIVNTDTPEESITWGIRWLYHKAQGIIKDEERYWHSWKEAVMNYKSEGDKSYQQKVYDIYEKGQTKQGIKLWSVLLIPLLLFVLGSGLWLFLNQGEVFVSFKDIEGTDDYKTVIRILDGLKLKRIDLAITYANAGNFFAIDKDKSLEIEFFDINNDNKKEKRIK